MTKILLPVNYSFSTLKDEIFHNKYYITIEECVFDSKKDEVPVEEGRHGNG